MPLDIYKNRLLIHDAETTNTPYISIDAFGETQESINNFVTAALNAKSSDLANYSQVLNMLRANNGNFDGTKSYQVGDYVVNTVSSGYQLYRFVTPHIAGNEWSSHEVIEVNLTQELKSMREGFVRANPVDLISMLNHGDGQYTYSNPSVSATSVNFTWTDSNTCVITGRIDAVKQDGSGNNLTNNVAFYGFSGYINSLYFRSGDPYIPAFIEPGKQYGVIWKVKEKEPSNLIVAFDFGTKIDPNDDKEEVTGLHYNDLSNTNRFFINGEIAGIQDRATALYSRILLSNGTSTDMENIRVVVEVKLILLNGEIAVQDTTPESDFTRLWINPNEGVTETEVPTYVEFQVLQNTVQTIKTSIPDPPTADGEYRLTATVTNGTVSYSWINTDS